MLPPEVEAPADRASRWRSGEPLTFTIADLNASADCTLEIARHAQAHRA